VPVGYSTALTDVIRLPLRVIWTCTGPYRVDTAFPVTVREPLLVTVPGPEPLELALPDVVELPDGVGVLTAAGGEATDEAG
jgi:hypothetical protein